MAWDSDVYVTASNSSPGRTLLIDGQAIHSATRSDNGLGINSYIAGGQGPGGTVVISFEQHQQSGFGELRVANPYTLADVANKYGIDSYEVDVSSSGGSVTADLSQSAIHLQTDVSSLNAARLRTNTYCRYQTGRGQRVLVSSWHDAPLLGQTRNWGYYDDSDGLMWRLSGTEVGVVRRSSTSGVPVDQFTAQSQWNVDKMDGSGKSGVNLDVTKGNIYEVKFQWLGVGIVHWFVNGYLVHVMNHPNTIAGPYMRTATLPVSADVVNETNVGVSGSGMRIICANVTSEGGSHQPEYSYAVSTSATRSNIPTGPYTPVLAIRLAATLNGVDNREIVLPKDIEVFIGGSAGATRASYVLVLNPSALTGGAWTSVGGGSGVEYSDSMLAYTDGIVVERHSLPPLPQRDDIDLTPLFEDNARKLRRSAFAGISDILLIAIRAEGAGTAEADATISWTEIK
jgi:hypothetical protein